MTKGETDEIKAALMAAYYEGYIQGAHHPVGTRIVTQAKCLTDMYVQSREIDRCGYCGTEKPVSEPCPCREQPLSIYRES